MLSIPFQQLFAALFDVSQFGTALATSAIGVTSVSADILICTKIQYVFQVLVHTSQLVSSEVIHNFCLVLSWVL